MRRIIQIAIIAILTLMIFLKLKSQANATQNTP